MTFKDFGFGQEIMDGLDSMRFLEPTPVQEKSIPAIQKGNDLIAVAQTGTGKTAAYIIPCLEKTDTEKKHIQSKYREILFLR